LKKKITPYIYILFFCSFLNKIYSQNPNIFSLQITSLDSIENALILKKKYTRKLQTKDKVLLEINQYILSLKKEGFYTISKDSIVLKNQTYKAYINLGKKTVKALIKLPKKNSIKFLDLNYAITKNHIELPVKEIAYFLKKTSNKMSNLGMPFSQVKLLNIHIKKDVLYANLSIEKSSTRSIDSVIVKGYENFPKNYLKSFYNFQQKKTFNKKQLLQISKQTELIPFAEELKPPEVLFSKDSTILYLYLQKKKANSFDGLINFSSNKNNKGISFNGYLDVMLNNVFNFGEKLAVNWRNTGENKLFFEINTKTPYIFGTKMIAEASFNIYKHDSTFLNTTAAINLSIPINNKIALGFFYTTEKSNYLPNQGNSIDIESFNNTFGGIELNYQSYLENQFNFKINISAGNRETSLDKSFQYKMHFTSSILLKLNQRVSLFLKNNTGYLNSKNYLQNEVFRIGGVNSIRGFNEQSIFSPIFSFINTEFRLSTQKKSHLYSVFDLGLINNQNTTKNLFGFGFGYVFKTNRNSLNLSYVIGKSSDTPLEINASRISIKILTLF